MLNEKWCKRFMSMAKLVSTWSKDKHQVGAIIVDPDKRIIGLGYNGFAKHIQDTPTRLSDKELKRALMIHAEENAILNTYENDTKDGVIFIYGYPPCLHCTNILIQAGIKKIYFYSPEDISEFWKTNLEFAKTIALEADLQYIDLKEKFKWEYI